MSDNPLEPLYDQILIQEIDTGDETTSGGIILAKQGEDPAKKGVVVAHGEGMLTTNGELVPLKVDEGTTVFFQNGKGVPIRHAGEEYLVIRQQDILVVER